MTANKPLHALFGIMMIITGIVCHAADVPPKGPYYFFLIFFGIFWAVVPGHIFFLFEPLFRKISFPIALPFHMVRYYKKSPVRYRKRQPVYSGDYTVFAYQAKRDHIYLVRGHKSIPRWPGGLLPRAVVEYRHHTVIEKTIESLKAVDVPEVSIDIPRVQESLEKILKDPRLKDCFGAFDETEISYSPEAVKEYLHQIGLFLVPFLEKDRSFIDDFVWDNRTSISTLEVWLRFVEKDPIWPDPVTTMDKIMYKWWY